MAYKGKNAGDRHVHLYEVRSFDAPLVYRGNHVCSVLNQVNRVPDNCFRHIINSLSGPSYVAKSFSRLPV